MFAFIFRIDPGRKSRIYLHYWNRGKIPSRMSPLSTRDSKIFFQLFFHLFPIFHAPCTFPLSVHVHPKSHSSEYARERVSSRVINEHSHFLHIYFSANFCRIFKKQNTGLVRRRIMESNEPPHARIRRDFPRGDLVNPANPSWQPPDFMAFLDSSRNSPSKMPHSIFPDFAF